MLLTKKKLKNYSKILIIKFLGQYLHLNTNNLYIFYKKNLIFNLNFKNKIFY